MGSSMSIKDAYMLSTIILASATGFLLITLIITCCCCFKTHRKLIRTGYGPESGGPSRGRMRSASRKNGCDNHAAYASQWTTNPYDRWVEDGGQGSSPACPNCCSKVGCGCRSQSPPDLNWAPTRKDGVVVYPISEPHSALPCPTAHQVYDKVLIHAAQTPAGPYYTPSQLESTPIGGGCGAPYLGEHCPNVSSSQLGMPGNSYNNLGSSTAQFVLQSAVPRF